jgi:hypothetical protein
MPSPAASEAAIKRALDAAKGCGLRIMAFSVSRDGTVFVQTAESVDTPPANAPSPEPKRWQKR